MNRFKPYRKKNPHALPIVLILLAIFISFSAVRGLFGVRSVFQAFFYPFQYVAVSVWKGVTGVPSSVAGLRGLASENSRLKEELKELRSQQLVLQGMEKENVRLRSVLDFGRTNPYYFRLLPAQIIGRAPTPWFSILEINQGSRAGVKTGSVVVAVEGLVGQVIEVSNYSSKVMLLVDAESSVAAVSERSRDFGVLVGNLSSRLFMRYVGAGGDLQAGDLVTTSLLSTVFPPGIPAGRVVRASKREHDLFYHVEVAPLVDFSKLEEVFVVL